MVPCAAATKTSAATNPATRTTTARASASSATSMRTARGIASCAAPWRCNMIPWDDDCDEFHEGTAPIISIRTKSSRPDRTARPSARPGRADVHDDLITALDDEVASKEVAGAGGPRKDEYCPASADGLCTSTRPNRTSTAARMSQCDNPQLQRESGSTRRSVLDRQSDRPKRARTWSDGRLRELGGRPNPTDVPSDASAHDGRWGRRPRPATSLSGGNGAR